MVIHTLSAIWELEADLGNAALLPSSEVVPELSAPELPVFLREALHEPNGGSDFSCSWTVGVYREQCTYKLLSTSIRVFCLAPFMGRKGYREHMTPCWDRSHLLCCCSRKVPQLIVQVVDSFLSFYFFCKRRPIL